MGVRLNGLRRIQFLHCTIGLRFRLFLDLSQIAARLGRKEAGVDCALQQSQWSYAEASVQTLAGRSYLKVTEHQ
jgi:hypothetical protein